MAILVNPLLILSPSDRLPWSKEVTVDPVTGEDKCILNTTENKVKVWYSGTWNIWFDLTPGTPPILYKLLLESDAGIEADFLLLESDIGAETEYLALEA